MGGALTAMCGIFNPAASASYISSIQRGTITIAAGATTGTATISSVTTSRAFLIICGYTTDNTSENGAEVMPRITLTNATTITATRNTSDAVFGIVVRYVIIDPTSTLVESAQYGTITITSGTTNTATITSVDTARSAVFYLGNTTNSTTNTFSRSTGVTLTNATTVTANCESSSTTTTSFVVVQFASGIISSVQKVSDAYTTSNTTDTKTITSVTTSRTMIAYGGQTCTSNRLDIGAYTLELTSSTNINLIRGSTNASSRTAYYTVVEFASGPIKSLQRGTITIATLNTSNTATITTIDTAKTIGNFTGMRHSVANGILNISTANLALTNSTTLTAARNTSDSSTSSVGYEAVEFN